MSGSSSSSLDSVNVQSTVAFENIMMTYTLESSVSTSNDDNGDEHDDMSIGDHDELNPQAQVDACCIKHNFTDKEMIYLLRGVAKMGENSWPQIYEHYKDKFDSDKTPDDLEIRYLQIKNCKYAKLLYKHIFH
jgi:hypothetical protein